MILINHKCKLILLYGVIASALVGCGNDSAPVPLPTADPSPPPVSLSVAGGGVKGPLIAADVSLFAVDLTAQGLQGALIDTGTTGDDASIQGLEVPDSLTGLVILEFGVNDGTTDLTTGLPPVFNRLVTLFDAQRLIDGDDVYATALTTLAVELAIANADSGAPYAGNGDGAISDAELLAALDVAQNQAVSTLGFGLSADVDIFTVPPLVTDDTSSTEDLQAVAAYRQAVEAIAAVADAVAQDIGGDASAQDAFTALIEDLTDGDIDGQSSEGAIPALATVVDNLSATVTQDPSTLVIPGTDTPVQDIETLLAGETETTGTTTDVAGLESGDIDVQPEPAMPVVDSDSDGVTDDEDVFPGDPTETADTDEDGVGDNADAFPEDASETADTDEDGVGDNADAFPEDATETTDTDEDGVGDNADVFPEDPNETADADEDGVGDNADAFPNDPDETADTDGDGIGDNGDDTPLGEASPNDADNDGVLDADDAFPNDPTEAVDSDNDGVGDNSDNCIADPNPDQSDIDNDGVGDVCDELPNAVWNQFNWNQALWQ